MTFKKYFFSFPHEHALTHWPKQQECAFYICLLSVKRKCEGDFFLSEQNTPYGNSNFNRMRGKWNRGGYGQMSRERLAVRTDMSAAKKI